MLNLNEVLEFIINSNPDEFNQIKNKVEIKKNQLAQRTKESIRLGDIVGIKHAQIDPKKNFRVIKKGQELQLKIKIKR